MGAEIPHRRHWRIHPKAKEELKALPANGQQGLVELMDRVRKGAQTLPRETANYGKGLRGLKYSEAHNEFRCYYGTDGKYGQYLVAVEFMYKKTEGVSLDTARARLTEWKEKGDAARTLRTKKKN